MTANQRRSGFRLPWLSEDDDPGAEGGAASPSPSPDVDPAAAADPPAPATNGSTPTIPAPADPTPALEPTAVAHTADEHSGSVLPQTPAPQPAPGPAPTAQPTAQPAADEPPGEFLRDLIAAMRAVADEARASGVTKVKADADEAVRRLEADAERRRDELRQRAEADVNGVAEWARAEAERIKAEAEQRVAARQAQLEQQLAAEGTRSDAEAEALRSRVRDYERELDAYHAQLGEINDPAAFAAAAKRMPRPPDLTPPPAPSVDVAPAPVAATPAAAVASGDTPTAPGAEPIDASPADPSAQVHPAEEEVLAARLAALDEKPEPNPDPVAAPGDATPAPAPVITPDPAPPASETTTDIVVKGLGSFGAITGFRQSLSAQPGIAAVALSLGQTGEFVFRATHATGFDLAGAIGAMEGDNATVEPRPDGGLRVTLERSR